MKTLAKVIYFFYQIMHLEMSSAKWCLNRFDLSELIAFIRINTLRPIQSGRHIADIIFNCIFLNENVWISIKNSLKFVPKDPMNNIPALVQIMAWRRPGDKPFSAPMMVNLLTHICVTRPQWVNPCCAETGMFQENSANSRACKWLGDARSQSIASHGICHGAQTGHVLHEKGFQLPVPL